jgi:hypothetical protein
MKISDIAIESSVGDKILYWTDSETYIRNHRTSKTHSQKINQLLDDPDTGLILDPSISGVVYTVLLGDLRLWVGNFPYAYGYVWDFFGRSNRHMPDRATVFRLRQVVEAAKASQA